MKKYLLTLLSVLFVFCSVLGIAACNEKYEIEVEGYTLQIEEDGTYSILHIPLEILEQSTWSVPEQIGEYPISHLGARYRLSGMWAPSQAPSSLGSIRKIYIPECIKSVCIRYTTSIKVWETEAPLSQIEFLYDSPLYQNAYFLSPYEENEKVNYLMQENIVDNMVIAKNEEGTEATLLYAFGDGELIIPDTYQNVPITRIGDEALSEERFTSVTLGANIKEIHSYAFSSLPIEEINFIEGITDINDSAFYGTNIKELILPSTLNTLGKNTFQDCKIESFDLSATNITTLPLWTFSGNPLTGTLVFPRNLTKIDSYAFLGTGITEINLPSTLTTLSGEVFGNCVNLKSLTLPDSVNDFELEFIESCKNLESLHLGMISSYSEGEFYFYPDLPKLQTITVSPQNESFLVENGILYSKDKGVLYKCPSQLNITSLTIDSKTVYDYAFYGNNYIQKVECTSNCRTIENCAFEKCTALKSVTLPKNITQIQFATFRGCTALETINTGFVKEFKNSCFANCSSLQAADFSSAYIVGHWAFRACDLREVILGDDCDKVESCAFADNENLKAFNGGRAVVEDNALYNTPLWKDRTNTPSTGCNRIWSWPKKWEWPKIILPK